MALANEGGGQMLLGVSDQRPRTIVGTQAFPQPGRTEAGLRQRLGHRIPVEEFQYDNRRVLIVHVPARLPRTAWHLDGRYLKRAGDELAPLGDAELKSMFDETGPDFSAQPCAARVADLSPEALADFRSRWVRKAGNPRIAQQTDAQTLVDAELMIDGELTHAALILFGTRSALGRHLAQAEIVFEYRSSEASGPAQDRTEFRDGFFLVHDRLWEKINLRNDRQSYQDGLFRYDIPTFDEAVVREALLNAFSHRDYRLGGSVFVRQYAQRLEIVSPGGFPPGIGPENIIDQRHLTDSGAEGAPIRDLLQVLPALSRSQVKRLLRELAVEGRAQVIGVTRAGRWFAIGKAGRIGSAGDDDPKKTPIRDPIDANSRSASTQK